MILAVRSKPKNQEKLSFALMLKSPTGDDNQKLSSPTLSHLLEDRVVNYLSPWRNGEKMSNV